MLTVRNIIMLILILTILLPHTSFSQKYGNENKITVNNENKFNHQSVWNHKVPKSCHCVAFRFDDVQDYYLNRVQIAVMDTFQQKNSSLTIGLIGNYFGNDTLLLSYIKTKIHNGSSELEIANHGWNHEDFTTFNKSRQSELITKTNEKILHLLGIKPVVFIPPYNSMNNDLIENLQEKKFAVISSNETEMKPTDLNQQELLYYLPSTVVTGDLNNDNTNWYAINHTQAFMNISHSLAKYGYAVVEMHPFEHSLRNGLHIKNEVDANQIHELRLLIDEVRNNGIKIVTMSEIPKYVTDKTIPAWTSNIFKWYEDGTISETEAVKTLSYLIEKKIVIL